MNNYESNLKKKKKKFFFPLGESIKSKENLMCLNKDIYVSYLYIHMFIK